MTNNSVSVGHSNTGNVCGGNLTINHSLPCKNGDGMLGRVKLEVRHKPPN